MKRSVLCFGLLFGCAGQKAAPSGPAPEYELPRIPPWDAGTAAPASEVPFVDEVGDEGASDAAAAGDAAGEGH